MKKADIELGVEYVPTHGTGRIRFVSLTSPKDPADYPVYDRRRGKVEPAWRIKPGALPAEQLRDQHRWVPVLVRPADVSRRWDHPDEVAKRERLESRQAKAARARELLAEMGLSVDSEDRFRRWGEPEADAAVSRISTAPTPNPLVEIDLDAFLRVFDATS